MHKLKLLLFLAAAFLLSCTTQNECKQQAAANKVDVRFYLAELQPDDTLLARTDPETGDAIYLHPQPITTTTDIVKADIGMDQFGNAALNIRLNEAATKKMRSATRNHIGKPAVIMIDNNIVVTAEIKSALSSSFQIAGAMNEQEVKAMRDKLVQ